jgi:hypothetical protein
MTGKIGNVNVNATDNQETTKIGVIENNVIRRNRENHSKEP